MKGHSRPLFLFNAVNSCIDTLLMVILELWTQGVGSNQFPNSATTPAYAVCNFAIWEFFLELTSP